MASRADMHREDDMKQEARRAARRAVRMAELPEDKEQERKLLFDKVYSETLAQKRKWAQ
jgi:hypothetical protein